MNKLIWLLILLLAIAHQDFWNWNDPTLVLGFFPLGLLYHVGISLAATVLWYLATLYCWPTEWIESIEGNQAGGTQQSEIKQSGSKQAGGQRHD